MTHPCMSPTTVTGALTWTTFDSRMRTSFVFSHISLSSASWRSCFRSSCWIQASRSKGAIAGIRWRSRELTWVCCCDLFTCSSSKHATSGSVVYKFYPSSPALYISPVSAQISPRLPLDPNIFTEIDYYQVTLHIVLSRDIGLEDWNWLFWQESWFYCRVYPRRCVPESV